MKNAALYMLFMALLPLAGCGYSHNGDFGKPTSSAYQWHSLYREDVQTVAIPIFANREFARGVEFDLSKALVNTIEAHTPYKVVPRERADTVIEGEVTQVQVSTLSRLFREAVPQEQMFIVTVNFTWKDLRTGQVLLERRDFQQTAQYYPTLAEGQFQGSQQAIEKLALAITQELEAEW